MEILRFLSSIIPLDPSPMLKCRRTFPFFRPRSLPMTRMKMMTTMAITTFIPAERTDFNRIIFKPPSPHRTPTAVCLACLDFHRNNPCSTHPLGIPSLRRPSRHQSGSLPYLPQCLYRRAHLLRHRHHNLSFLHRPHFASHHQLRRPLLPQRLLPTRSGKKRC